MKKRWRWGMRQKQRVPFRVCRLLYRYYGIWPVILLDEYDTPLLEAYTDGYWEEMIGTCRQLFHAAFKENAYYSRAIITGVTRVTKKFAFFGFE